MYKVFINGSIELYRSPRIEDAVAFALSLHRSSNVAHEVSVYDPSVDQASVVFKLLEESKDGVRS